MTAFDELERQLLAGVSRLGDDPDARQVAGSQQARLRHWVRALPVLGAACLSIGVLVFALSALRASPRSPSASSHSSGDMVALLGVLRRRETRLDQTLLTETLADEGGINVAVPLVRFALRAPWGGALGIVAPPIDGRPDFQDEPRSQWLGGLEAGTGVNEATQAVLEEALNPFAPVTGVNGAVRLVAFTPEAVAAGRAVYAGNDAFYYASTEFSKREEVAVVVPDGVTKVEFVLPRQPMPIFGAPIYSRVRYQVAAVRNNVAATILDEPCCYQPEDPRSQNVREQEGDFSQTAPPAMIWYGSNGQVVKRIGDVAAAARVTPLRAPAPETALSRAAERNPATPNPVWVTPSQGDARTAFRVRFRVQLNGAEYYYEILREGTPRRQSSRPCNEPVASTSLFTGQALLPGLHLNAVRGEVWNDVLSFGDAEPLPYLCLGRYRISVGVANRGLFDPHSSYTASVGPGGSSWKPFGSAVFVVRPESGAPWGWLVPGLVALGLFGLAVAIARRRVKAPQPLTEPSDAQS